MGTQSLAIPNIIPGDWKRLDTTIKKIKLRLGSVGAPTFTGLTLSGLTASRLVWTDASKALASKDLVDLVAGTANRVTVADDSAGGITLSGPQDIATDSSPTFDDLDLTGDLDVVGDAAFGSAALTPLIGIYVSKNVNITSSADNSQRRGILSILQVGKTGAADYTGVITGVRTQVQLDDVNTQDWTNATSIRGFDCDLVTEGSTTGTVTGMAGVYLTANIQDAATVTNYYGVRLGLVQAFGNKLTNAYGIYLSDVDAAATLNYAIYTGTGLVRFGDSVNTTEHYEVDGTQVLSNQGAAIADATDAASAITQLNALLARCRTHGLIAT